MKNWNINFLKHAIITCSLLVIPSFAYAGTESVSCNTSVSYFGGTLIYSFAASASQSFVEKDLNQAIRQTNQSRLLTPQQKTDLVNHFNTLRGQRAQTALAGARTQCQGRVDGKVVKNTNHLKRVLRNAGISPAAYQISYSR